MEPTALPPAPEPANAAGEREPVGFWVRAGAMLIDSMLTGVVGVGAYLFVTATGAPPIISTLLGTVISLSYHTFMLGTWGQSVGKMAAGAEVITADGGKISYPRAFGRTAATYLSGIILALGHILAAFTKNKRALHDYIAGTRVVYRPNVGKGRKVALAMVGLLFPATAVLVGVLVATNPTAAALLGKSSTNASFNSMQLKAREGGTKSNLGMMRAGSALFYADSEGKYPETLEGLIPKYLAAIPNAKLGEHPESAQWTAYGAEICAQGTTPSIEGSKLTDSGQWGYVNDPKAPCWGQVFVDCTHVDTKGVPWHSY